MSEGEKKSPGDTELKPSPDISSETIIPSSLAIKPINGEKTPAPDNSVPAASDNAVPVAPEKAASLHGLTSAIESEMVKTIIPKIASEIGSVLAAKIASGDVFKSTPLETPVKKNGSAPEMTASIPIPEPADKKNWSSYHSIIFFGEIALLIILIYYGVTTGTNAALLWSIMLLLILTSIITAGHGIVGVTLGFLIDDRNRVALSRLQLILWTILVLSSFLASITVNLHSAYKPNMINTTAIIDAATIAMPQEIWVLMGIATASLVGSPLILKKNKGQQGDLEETANRPDVQSAHEDLESQGRASSDITKFVEDQVDGNLIVNREPRYANLSDIFKGDYTNNAAQLDLGKVQMLYFTIIVLIAYAASLISLFVSGDPIHQFPVLSESMVTLLGISNGGYLLSKSVSPNK